MGGMNLSNILSLITTKPETRTAAELRAALAEIDKDAFERRSDELETQRRKLLVFGTPDELKAVDANLEDANLEWERASATADELKKLIAEAEKRETANTVEGTAVEARRLQRLLIEGYLAFDATANHLAGLRRDIEAAQKKLEDANTYLAAHRGAGPDLRIATPRQLLADQGIFQGDLPSLEWWIMPGYHPVPAALQVHVNPKPRPFGLAAKLK